MVKKNFVGIGVLLILSIFIYFKFFMNKIPEKEVHYHAGFIVFNNGQKVDFSNVKYMTISPCGVKGKSEKGGTNIQIEKAHLHDGVGDVVHVEAADSKWGDLFMNINYPIDYSKVTAYINHQKVDDVKDYPIKPYDSLVLFAGDVNMDLLNQAVTKDHIIKVGDASESCGN